ncbi:MAG TPA: aminoimidazole riboside kinase [Bacillales bacterium]|nr:aminoimidazole riboside kinase [Bacillales bacterium]
MSEGILCLGEALVDFIPTDAKNRFYEKCPGGAPANVAVGLARLGVKTSFIGKVGDDLLGEFLLETLRKEGVDVTQAKRSDEARTGLTFVKLAEGGERDFSFYIEPSADQFLREEELDAAGFRGRKLLHLGSITLIREPARTATKRAVERAKAAGLKVSFDPNVRLGLWPSEARARAAIVDLLGQVDVLKLSEDELAFLTGEASIDAGVEALRRRYEIPLVFVTRGAEGSRVVYGDVSIDCAAMKVKAIDTTGAGDAYVSGILYGLHERGFEALDEKALKDIVRLASISGGLAASKKGAMTALPTLAEVQNEANLPG